jgi:molecular chaperone GrpE
VNVSNHDDSELGEKTDEVVSDVNPNELKALLEEAQKKAAENWDLFLRARAEGDNTRRRTLLDVENAHKYGIEKFARELLAVVDSLDQGLSLFSSSSNPQNIDAGKEGVELTYKLLLNVLDKFGIKVMDPVGADFDPSKHEALSTQPNNQVAANKVLIVVQKGFTIYDRVLRPARVIVSRKEEAINTPSNGVENPDK